MEASQVLDVRTHLLVLLGGDAGLRAMLRDSVLRTGVGERNGPFGTAGNVSYDCFGRCAWTLTAGGYVGGGSSSGALRVVTDPAYLQYPYPFVVQISVMQNSPALYDVYAAVIVGASTRPLSGEFVLPTFDAFDRIFGYCGILVPGPAGGGNRISTATVSVTSTRSVREPVSLILLTIGVGSGIIREPKWRRCRGLVA